MTDGGTVGITETDSTPAVARPTITNAPSRAARPVPRATNGGRAGADAPKAKRSATPPVDCFVEQLQMTDGYVPSGECPAPPHAADRWVVDEDKQMGRHWQGERAR